MNFISTRKYDNTITIVYSHICKQNFDFEIKIDTRSDIFHDIIKLKKFLIDNEICRSCKLCTRCGSNLILKFIVHLKKIDHRCTKKGFQSKQVFYNTKLLLPKFVQAIFFLICELNYKQLYVLLGLNNSTIIHKKESSGWLILIMWINIQFISEAQI